MKKNKIFILSLFVLSILYFGAIFANFIAPYKYDAQYREYSFCKPSKIGFDFKEKKFYFYKYILENKALKTYKIDKKIKIDFFVKGYEYKFLFFKFKTHLFGSVDKNAKIFLFGCDKHGRDIFSRSIIASRIIPRETSKKMFSKKAPLFEL